MAQTDPDHPQDTVGLRLDFSGPSVHLNKHYEIFCSKPVQELDPEGLRYFPVRHDDPKRPAMVGAVTRLRTGPRGDLLSAFQHVESLNHMQPVAAGIVEWPGEGVERFVTVFDLPVGRPLMPTLATPIKPMSEERIIKDVFAPVVSLLRLYAEHSIFHGSIRPTTMFAPPDGRGGVQLGECVSMPAGYDQPALFETIERAAAEPAGRGAGTISEDLYALAVSIVVLILGQDPLHGRSAHAIIAEKLDKGTYPALLGNLRLTGLLVEPLRALLHDDPRERWNLDEVNLWLNGRRLSPKQASVQRKAARALEVMDSQYWRPRSVAKAFGDNPTVAMSLIEKGELDRWLRRSASQAIVADRVIEGIKGAAAVGKTGAFEDRLVARVCIALDPDGPIRYRGRSVLPGGIAAAIAHDMANGKDPTALAEIVATQLPLFWFNARSETAHEWLPLVKSLDLGRTIMGKTLMGYGLERLAYELVPNLPCLSPMFDRFVVLTPADVVGALERVAAASNRPGLPIDRHVAAFLAARDGHLRSGTFSSLSSEEEQERLLAQLEILAALQRRHGNHPAPKLSQWMGDLVAPLTDFYRNIARRSRIQNNVKEAAKGGNLGALYNAVYNQAELTTDAQEFQHARAKFAHLNEEALYLISAVRNRKALERGPGQETAATLSGFLSLIGITLIIASRLTLF